MTYKQLLELLQGLDETQLNKELTIYIPDDMSGGFTTDIWDAFCYQKWSVDIKCGVLILKLILPI